MKIKFHTYCGIAGDEHELIVGVSKDGEQLSEFYNRMFFPYHNLRRAKKKILKRFEILTGKKCKE